VQEVEAPPAVIRIGCGGLNPEQLIEADRSRAALRSARRGRRHDGRRRAQNGRPPPRRQRFRFAHAHLLAVLEAEVRRAADA
jgi:hypothetical protein